MNWTDVDSYFYLSLNASVGPWLFDRSTLLGSCSRFHFSTSIFVYIEDEHSCRFEINFGQNLECVLVRI